MTRPTLALIQDIANLALGREEQLRSSQLDRSLMDAAEFEARCRRWAMSNNVLMIDAGPKIVDGVETDVNALRVWVRNKPPRTELSRPVPRVLRHEAFPDVPTDVVEVDSDVAAAGQLFAIRPGHSCSRVDDVIGTGTMTCFCRGQANRYAITAGHVLLMSGETEPNIQVHGAGLRDTPTVSVIGRANRRSIALVLEQTNEHDIAAIRLKNDLNPPTNPRPLYSGPIQGVRPPHTLRRRERVHLFGAASQRPVIGRIWKGISAGPALFSNTQTWFELINFIDVRFEPDERPIPGDSGALVVDMRGFAIGIYVGGALGSGRRYVSPLSSGLALLGLSPVWR